MNAVSLSIGSACRSIFLQTSRCLVGLSSELYLWMLQTIISINICFSDVFQRNYFIFFHYSNTPPPQTAEEMWTTNLSHAILNILPHFDFSFWHIVVHALSPLALWCWCNMLIQLLSMTQFHNWRPALIVVICAVVALISGIFFSFGAIKLI